MIFFKLGFLVLNYSSLAILLRILEDIWRGEHAQIFSEKNPKKFPEKITARLFQNILNRFPVEIHFEITREIFREM